MEASALRHPARAPSLAGLSPYLRLQSDERLVALTRRGSNGAFEALVKRYESRLLTFCRHMLASSEDAEDVLQEVFAAAYNAMLADTRPINVRPWLYRIARNRSLNHLRRPVQAGQDSMDVYERDGGTTTADTVHQREEFRQIVADVQQLPESQRSALLLREIDALSYEQIAEAMETTVPSVKSLLVRARVSLAEAAESRLLSCDEVRVELGEVAQGLARSSAPVRRHLKGCDRCRVFRGELRRTSRALAAVYPVGPLVIAKNLLAAKLGTGAAAGGSGLAGGSSVAAGGTTLFGGAAAAGGGASGAVSMGIGAITTKAAAGLVAASIVTAGVVEVKHLREPDRGSTPSALYQAANPGIGEGAVLASREPVTVPKPNGQTAPATSQKPEAEPGAPSTSEQEPATAPPVAEPEPEPPADEPAEPASSVAADTPAAEPTETSPTGGTTVGAVDGTSPPGESPDATPIEQPAPVAGEPTAKPAPSEPKSSPEQTPRPRRRTEP